MAFQKEVSEIIHNLDEGLVKGGVLQEDNCFELTSDQDSAIRLIKQWYSQRGTFAWKPYYVLSGAAGTGKSSLIQYIIKNLGVSESECLCTAFTGKATLNMNRKGNYSSTLHSSLYEYEKRTENGEPEFRLKSWVPFKLIVVDEASMISQEMFDDILSFMIPTIFIGDHCQLPPIDGKFNIMLNPDFTLTKIMRQAKESPIIRASQLAIQGKPIPFCKMKGFQKIRKEDLDESHLLWADQIVVGTNASRKALNEVIREIRGYDSPVPAPGERMIVLQNNRKYSVFNGQIIYLEEQPFFMQRTQAWSSYFLDELEKNDPLMAIVGGKRQITFKVSDPPKNTLPSKEIVYLDYGYAISCHKSQGSGWEKVLVMDEGFGWDEDTKRRWLYTAITRAKKEILIVK